MWESTLEGNLMVFVINLFIHHYYINIDILIVNININIIYSLFLCVNIYLCITYAMPSTFLFFVAIRTDPILCDGIKSAVVARAKELKKFHEVQCLDAEGHKICVL